MPLGIAGPVVPTDIARQCMTLEREGGRPRGGSLGSEVDGPPRAELKEA